MDQLPSVAEWISSAAIATPISVAIPNSRDGFLMADIVEQVCMDLSE